MVDGIHSGTNIANHFKNKYNTLYNSVTSNSTLMDSLRNRIELSVHTNCNADSNNYIHCHVYNYCGVVIELHFLHGYLYT